MDPTLRFRSLRTRLAFWLLVVTMATLVSVVAILYFQRARGIRGREFEKLEVVRNLKVRQLGAWLEERMADVSMWASDLELRGAEEFLPRSRREWGEQDRQLADSIRGFLQRHEEAYDAYHEVFIVDAIGARVAISSDAGREGRDKRDDLYFTEPIRARKPYMMDIYESKTEGKPAMAFSAPITCMAHDGEHIIGVLVARANLEHVLYPLLQDPAGAGETGETIIVNSDLVALNELRWYARAPLALRTTGEPIVKAAAGQTGIIETRDYRGEMVLAAYAHIPLTGWGLIAKRDLTEVYRPIRLMMRDTVLILGGAVFVVLGVAVLLARSISEPIISIGDTVQRVAEGDLTARCSAAGADEVATLGTSFNAMADVLASRIAVQQGIGELAGVMVTAGDVAAFASGLVMELLDLTASHLGAFYMRSEGGSTFELVTSVGLTEGAAPSFAADSCEGELGRALATREPSVIRDISESTVFTFRTSVGTAIPREIITIPLVVAGEVRGVVSLATLGAYTQDHRDILDEALVAMSTAFASVLASDRTTRMADEVRAANEELASLNEEMQEQAAELEAQRVEVEEASRLKSEFLSNMSHELRTPLNSVMALSELMISRGPGQDPEQDAEHLRVIQRNGRQLLALINDVLDLSKIEAGRVTLTLTDFDPRELVARVLETVRPIADERGLALQAEVTDVPRMYSDEDRISQILSNLLFNATKFTGQGGIALRVSCSGDRVIYTVSDTGIGIDDAHLDHVFEEFRQADGSTTRRYEGTGLGLTICRRLAHLLGGDVTVESTVGEGSTFTLSLPVRCPETALAAVERLDVPGVATEARAKPYRPLREEPLILVVDDSEIAAMQVRSALEENGYQVHVAASAGEGLEYVASAAPDAIVLDLMMPEMDGFQFLEALHSSPQAADVPVLVLTARELDASDLARLERNNIRQLLQKGDVDLDSLLDCVASLLPHSGQPAAVRGSGLTETILIVEDNADNLLTIKAILDSIGRKYVTAGDGEQAVLMARESRPGLIFMDIQLPVMSGLEATRRIKADPALSETPIVALTSKAMAGDREGILAAGCDDYISKPVALEDVAATVRKWLGKQRGTRP